mmetsp:Transcript_37087/g.87024  ORF Transcript_37087/g.87024 Transcript_37087/m.87024 type:complete len:390 (-) Transcript_37087:250-1419(-)
MAHTTPAGVTRSCSWRSASSSTWMTSERPSSCSRSCSRMTPACCGRAGKAPVRYSGGATMSFPSGCLRTCSAETDRSPSSRRTPRARRRGGSAAGARRQRAAECADRLRRQLEQEAAEEAEWARQCERDVAAAEEAEEKAAEEEEADAQGATPVAAPLGRGHRRKVLRVADGDEPMTCEGAAEAVDAAAAPAADDDDEGDDVLSGGARRRRKAEHARQVAALDGLAARPTADSLAEYGAPVVEERLKRLGLATVAPGDQRARRSIASENVRAPAEARCDAYVERTITFFETLRPGAELVAASALDFALTADDYSLLSVKLLARILHGRCLGHLAPGALAMCLPKLAGQTRAWLAQRIVDPALADGFAEARIEPVSGWRCGRNLNLRAER